MEEREKRRRKVIVRTLRAAKWFGAKVAKATGTGLASEILRYLFG